MTDLLAVLDQAIDELSAATTSHFYHGSGCKEGALVTVKVLNEKALARLPRFPTPKQDGLGEQTTRDTGDSDGDEQRAIESTLKNLVNLGNTVSGVDSVRLSLTISENEDGKAGKSADHASEADWDAYEERAAIIEYDAGLPRAEAERRAWQEVFGDGLGTSHLDARGGRGV